MYFQGKAERSLSNKSLQQRKCSEFQTNETAAADFVVIMVLHVCKRKDINGTLILLIHLQLSFIRKQTDPELELKENAFWGIETT